ncbi:hypothetical protein [Undibacterium sp. Xuan67W]
MGGLPTNGSSSTTCSSNRAAFFHGFTGKAVQAFRDSIFVLLSG